MDFKRIELIFIVVFACLNAYLLGSYWQYQNNAMGTSTSTSTSVTTILKEMRNDQINYVPLSDKNQTGYYASAKINDLRDGARRLTGQSYRISDNRLYSSLNDPITINGKNPQKTLDAFVKNKANVINGNQYDYNANLSSSSQIVYTQKINHKTVFDKAGQIIFNVNGNQEVTGYTQGYLFSNQQLRPAVKLISQTKAATLLYQYNEISNNSQIKWVELGYTHILSNSQGEVYVPTWVLGVKSKSTGFETKRINAISGVLIKKDVGVATEPVMNMVKTAESVNDN